MRRTSRNRAKAGFAWHVVFIAVLADFQLSRNSVYVSSTTGFVNYEAMQGLFMFTSMHDGW